MKNIFDLLVSFFQVIVTIDFFKHMIMCCVIVWLFGMVYYLGKRV